MYRCGLCNTVVRAKQSAIKIVTKSREIQYKDVPGHPARKGYEIIEEVNACAKCAKEHKGTQVVRSS